MTTATAADILATLPRTDGPSVTISVPPGGSTVAAVTITSPCNDRCAMNGEHAPECNGDDDSCQYAPHSSLDGGGVRCGCSGCSDIHVNDYGCHHGVEVDCTCVEDALAGPTC